jgi:hypothetical protein
VAANLNTHPERPSIRADRRQIRIIELLPGTPQDEIRCASHIANLDDNPVYEALSYVWGDSRITKRIYVDGRPMEITVNLESALRHIRKPAESRFLWIDAICINQNNNAEKTHQVHLMGDIYGNTEQCLLWLGDLRSLGIDKTNESLIELIHMFNSEQNEAQQP